MKKYLFIAFLSFLIYRNNSAQSFSMASENVVIRIIAKVYVTVGYELKPDNVEKYYDENFKKKYSNLIIDFNDIGENIKNNSTTFEHSFNREIDFVKDRKQHITDERLYVNIKNYETKAEHNSKRFVTIVY